MTAVDARFAGGSILVEPVASVLDGRTMVRIQAPGYEVVLFPHEADRLAEALSDRGTVTEEGAARDDAAESIHLMLDAETRRPDFISLTTDYPIELSRSAALAYAQRLIELAAQIPDRPAILRRRRDIDEALRDHEI
ncbi:hypothetical protein IF188_13985 [Microbacterium sp. NEAU-LLC]|uniref:Uncharacterized protein n=1 Tax=Microbacterium helvum TaxID=2773713 RepID=A0ABR8NUT1_9MICO|nr:hypothetical protein [Microbacterium helvum]MBD3942806.1 hypothetical protein [Microbacterium helvum]